MFVQRACLTLLAWVVCLAPHPVFAGESAIRKLPTNFALAGMSGKQLSPADFRSGVYIMQFWASWCYSCSVTMRDLSKWSDGRRGVKFIQVSVDEKMSEAEAYFTGKNASLDFLKKSVFLDPEGKLASQLGVQSIPTVLLLSKDGRVLRVVAGHPNQTDLKEFERIVAQVQG